MSDLGSGPRTRSGLPVVLWFFFFFLVNASIFERYRLLRLCAKPEKQDELMPMSRRASAPSPRAPKSAACCSPHSIRRCHERPILLSLLPSLASIIYPFSSSFVRLFGLAGSA